MTDFERKLLSKIDRNLPWIVAFAVTVLGVLIRLSLRKIVSSDATYFLLPWYKKIAMNGLYEQVGDYNLLYQFLIWVMTKLPLPPLYAYKALSCAGDVLLSVGAALWAGQIAEENKLWKSIWTYTAVMLCPIVFINSAAWAQCDAIFTAFAIWGLYFLEKERYNWAIISLGMSFAFKLHAVFILPVYLFVYFSRRKFSILRFSLVPVVMIAISSPMLFWGRNLMDTFRIYYQQTSTYPGMAHNYPSFWVLLCNPDSVSQYNNLKIAAILFVFCILAAIMVWWIRENYATTGKNLLIMAFLLSYTCVLFLPAMHERYGFLYEMCAILLAVMIPKTIPLCIGLLLVSLNAYSVFLFSGSANFLLLSFGNMALYIAYIWMLKPMFQKNDEAIPVT